MKLLLKILVLAGAGTLLCHPVRAQEQYTDYSSGIRKIEALAGKYPSLLSARSLVKTLGGREIMVLTVGTGNKDNKPGIAIAGGVEGPYLLGKEIAIGFTESLLLESETPEIRSLLDKVTFYIFPDVSPDASGQFFQSLKFERNGNARDTDDDRDFAVNEDPAEDLNNDGLITLIRVADPAGTYTESSDDKRVMVAADLAKGEHGTWSVHSEGIDNDKDGQFNEDGPGGVSFNRNLSYNYEEFGISAGLHPVSEPETKAVLDFLFDHFNIYAVFTFGPQDNLTQASRSGERNQGGQSQTIQEPPRQAQGQPSRSGERRINTVQRSDETVIKLVSEKYREITGTKGSAPIKTSPGNFADWAYFHYGRYSFTTPAWWPPLDREKNAEVTFLKYAEENKIEDVFVPWAEIRHPDFPDRKTEAGGIKPFVMINPPAGKLKEIISAHYKFITAVAGMHPELEFIEVRTENNGDNIFRVSLKVHNKGLFATCAEAGQNNMWTRLMALNFETAKGQSLLSGQNVQRISRLTGNGTAEFSWLVMGKGTVKVSAGAVNTGFIATTIDLK